MSRLKTDAIRNVNASVDGITLDTSGNVAIPNELQLADKIVHTGDTNTFIRFPSDDSFSITTNNVTRMTFSGNFVDLPDAGTIRLGNSNDLKISHGSGGASNIEHSNTSQPLRISATGAGSITFSTNSSERLRMDSSGRMLYGTTSSTRETSLVLVGNSNSYTTNPGTLDLFVGQTPQNLAGLGQICFGTQNVVGARIDGRADQDWNLGSARGSHLRFVTCANGSTSLTERLRITSTGAIQSFYNSSLPVTDSRSILQLGYSTIGDDSSGYNAVACNAYPVNGNSTWHYIGSSSLGASRYHIGFGDHKWFTAAAGTRGNDITWSEKLRLDSTGRLLVNQNTHQGSTSKLEVTGTLNNSYPGYSFPLMVSDDAAYNSSAGPGGGIGFSFKQNTGGQYAQAGGIRGIKENTTDGNYASALAFYTRPNGAGTAEKLRLDSSGDLQFRNNTTSHQGLKWYSNTGHLGLSFTYGEGNANPTLNIFRWDSQSGFPYGNLIINTGHSSSPTQALKLRTDKHIELTGSLIMANGQGIDFSATSDASGKTSELLSDYEEGTFTPGFGRTSTQPSKSFYSQTGRYIKIGKLVYCSVLVDAYNVSGGSGQWYCSNFPFNTYNDSNLGWVNTWVMGRLYFDGDYAMGVDGKTLRANHNTSTFYLYNQDDDSSETANASRIIFQGHVTYMTD